MEEKRIAGSIILDATTNENIKSEKAMNRLKALEIASRMVSNIDVNEGYGSERFFKKPETVLKETKELALEILDWAYEK